MIVVLECRRKYTWGGEYIFLEGLSQMKDVLECRRKCTLGGEYIFLEGLSRIKVATECRNEGGNSES